MYLVVEKKCCQNEFFYRNSKIYNDQEKILDGSNTVGINCFWWLNYFKSRISSCPFYLYNFLKLKFLFTNDHEQPALRSEPRENHKNLA